VPSHRPIEQMELTLLKSCTTNTVLIDAKGHPVYRVQTPFKFWTKRTMTISRVQPNYETSALQKESDDVSLSGLNLTQVAQIIWGICPTLNYKSTERPMREFLTRPSILKL
jgi:hypothetical protein